MIAQSICERPIYANNSILTRNRSFPKFGCTFCSNSHRPYPLNFRHFIYFRPRSHLFSFPRCDSIYFIFKWAICRNIASQKRQKQNESVLFTCNWWTGTTDDRRNMQITVQSFQAITVIFYCLNVNKNWTRPRKNVNFACHWLGRTMRAKRHKWSDGEHRTNEQFRILCSLLIG